MYGGGGGPQVKGETEEMWGVDERQLVVAEATVSLDKERVVLIREENVAYLFGCELYQGTFVALKGRKEKCERGVEFAAVQHSGKHWTLLPRHCVTMITLRSPGPRGPSVASRRLVKIYLLCYKGTNYLIHRVYHKYYPTAIKCTAIVPLFALSVLQHHLKPLVGEQ